MSIPESIQITAKGHPINIKVFNSQELSQNLNGQVINIFASGPSITSFDFTQSKLSQPTIFVNGSLSLINRHNFCHVAGYVISDTRFIKNNPEVLTTYYKGQNLYATMPVYESIAAHLPQLIIEYHNNMRVIFPIGRKLAKETKISWLAPSLLAKRITNRKSTLLDFVEHPNFIIDSSHKPQPIGVSLDVTSGFVEAGTVAYVASQLAFSLGVLQINLYGIDLLNANQPRFYESNDRQAPCKLDKAIYNRIVPSFKLMKQVYAKHGVQVINESNVSKELF